MKLEYGIWLENTLVCSDRTLITVLDDGTMEIRGERWRKRRGSHPGEDEVRVCKMGSVERARGVAEALAEILYEEEQRENEKDLRGKET